MSNRSLSIAVLVCAAALLPGCTTGNSPENPAPVERPTIKTFTPVSTTAPALCGTVFAEPGCW